MKNNIFPITLHIFSKNKYINIAAILFSASSLAMLSLLAYFHITEFAFVDEYNNWVIAKYMLEGRQVYTDIYLNHQMLIAYISYVLQAIARPETLYELVATHRLFVIAAALLFNMLIILRFAWVGLAFMLIFELTKYYLFGTLLLGESLIAYLVVYNAGIILEKIRGANLYWADYILAGFFTYAIIFLREPYGPLSVALFALILIGKKDSRQKIYTLALFAALTAITLLTVPIKDYLFQVVYVNATTILPSEAGLAGGPVERILQMLFYPLYVFIEGEWTYVRMVEAMVSALFIAGSTSLIVQKKYKAVFFIFALLVLSAVRITPPGREFYSAFYMLPYFALLTFSTAYMCIALQRKNLLKKAAAGGFAIIILFQIFYPHAFIRERSGHESFFQQYSNYYANGEIVKRLAQGDETLFVNGYDSLIYWQASTEPSFEYILFYPEMNAVPYFSNKMEQMFERKPPTYYFQNCTTDNFVIADQVKKNYTPMQYNNAPTCLFIRNDKVDEVRERLDRIEEFGYTI